MEGRKTHGMCDHGSLEISFLLRHGEVLLVYPGRRLVKGARWPMSLCSYRAGKKNLGIGQVSLQQSQGTAQLTPTAPKLLLGLPPEGGLHFPALDLLTWDMHHRYRADYLPRKIQPKAIFRQREYRFFVVSQKWQQLTAVKAKRHHSKSGTIQDVLKDRTEV